MAKYTQGIFKPRNPNKYRGDPTNIVFRSSWEFLVMQKFDLHPDVLEWSSEEVVIWYTSPIDNKPHRYFMDFKVKMKDKEGNIKTTLIEVKPRDQTIPPKVSNTKGNKPTKRYLNEVTTWGVNSAKWEAARKVCAKQGWNFEIIHEGHLFGK